MDEQNGLFYVKSELLLIVSRLELGNNIECRVESPSLDDEIITNYLALDLEGMYWSGNAHEEKKWVL